MSCNDEHFSRPNLKYIIGGSENSGASASYEDSLYSNHDMIDCDNNTYKPASSRSYVDETIHFSSLENANLNFNNIVIDTIPANIDSNYLPLDENYKSCKSILGHRNSNLRCRSSDNTKSAENIISKAKIIAVIEHIKHDYILDFAIYFNEIHYVYNLILFNLV